MKTVISHIYNESYLLPWWLMHHREYFDHGVIIDYRSTDNSVAIIKQLCPTWEVVSSRNAMFDAHLIDREVEDIERSIDGWRICLNTTEFLIGNYELLNNNWSEGDFLIPACVMVDSVAETHTNPSHQQPLIDQRRFGIAPYDGQDKFLMRRARKLSNYFSQYPLGRHYEHYNTSDFLILWYGFAPFNKFTLERKLQIQNNIPESDKARGWGVQHITNKTKLELELRRLQEVAGDLTSIIEGLYDYK